VELGQAQRGVSGSRGERFLRIVKGSAIAGGAGFGEIRATARWCKKRTESELWCKNGGTKKKCVCRRGGTPIPKGCESSGRHHSEWDTGV